MGHIENLFATLKKNNRKALIPYITAGDPDLNTTLELMHKLVEYGADLIELGVPFSDPMADGPVIQASHTRAVKNGVTLNHVFSLAGQFRHAHPDIPLVLMTYVNPVIVMGYDAFITQAVDAGIDGVLIVDMPFEEGAEFFSMLRSHAIAPIFLIAPTTSEARIKNISENAEGYLYYVSLKGVTGAGTIDTASIGQALKTLRKHTQLPVATGFGIHDGKTAAAAALAADAVIVGSAFIRLINENPNDHGQMLNVIGNLCQELRHALDEVQR